MAEPDRRGDQVTGLSRELDRAVVRVRSSTGQIVGSGFLVDSSHVVTCAHVVTAALGQQGHDRPRGDQLVDMEFPLVEPSTAVQARVEVWHRIENDDSGDIAVLSIVDEPPKEVLPARLVAAGDLWGHPFRAFGFPRGHNHGVWVSGVLRAAQGVGWVQMEGTASGYAVEGGFSGGAVWDDELAGVVGMTVAADSDSGTRSAYLITADRLHRAWPDLARRTLPPCPYRGLYSFRIQDSSSFFGRDDVAERLARDAMRRSMLSLVGPSGSGKSSVLYAGLLPRLQQQGSATLTMRPAQAPSAILALAGAFLELLEPELSETKRIVEIDALGKLMVEGHLPEVIDRVLARSPAEHLLLAIDQFEELFARGPEEVAEFMRVLLPALRDQRSSLAPRFTVLVTLRADFLNKALQDPALTTVLEDSVITIGQMRHDQLRAVIEGPLPQGVTYEAGLVDRILDDVGEETGSLPLLEFALTLLWEQQERGVMTHAAYEKLGGVDGALASYAERVFREQVRDEDRDQARRLFIQLARPSDVGTPVRRVARPPELGDARWQLAQRLASTRLLVADRDPTGAESVELVHEALITGWDRLNRWIEDDRAFRAWQEQLRNSLASWQKARHDQGALLRGAPLAEAETWLNCRRDDLGDPEADFIRRGVAARGRSTRRLGIATATLAMLLVAAIGLGGVVIRQLDQNAQDTLVSGSRDLARQSEALSVAKPTTAMLLAASSYRMHRTDESIRALNRIANDYQQVDTVMSTGLSDIQGVQFSPSDPNLLAIFGSDYAALYDVSTRSRRAFQPYDAELGVGILQASSFSPNGKSIAVSILEPPEKSVLAIWNPGEQTFHRVTSRSDPHGEDFSVVNFTPDSASVGFCVGSRIEVWSVRKRTMIYRTNKIAGPSNDCTFGFATDHDLLYVDDQEVLSLDIRSKKVLKRESIPAPRGGYDKEEGADISIVVAPNGQSALLVDNEGRVTLWDVNRGRPLGEAWRNDLGSLSGAQYAANGRSALLNGNVAVTTMDVSQANFVDSYALPGSDLFKPSSLTSMSKDGKQIVTALNGSDIALLSVGARGGIPVEVSSFALVEDDPDKIAAINDDERLVIYDRTRRTRTRSGTEELNQAIADSGGSALSPTGRVVALLGGTEHSTSDTGTVRLGDIDPARTTMLRTVKIGSKTVENIAFDPSGQFLAAVSGSNVAIASVGEGAIEKQLALPAEFDAEALALSTDSHFVGAIDKTGRASVWTVTSTLRTDLVHDGALALTFSPDGRWLIVDTVSGIQLWDTTNWTKWKDSPSPVRRVESMDGSVKFSGDERYVAVPLSSASLRFEGERREVEIRSVPELRLLGIAPFQGDYAFLPGGEELLAAGPGGIQVISFNPAQALDTVCRITANGNLTRTDWDVYAPGFDYVAACPPPGGRR